MDWPRVDPDGRSVGFTERDPRPRPDEMRPMLSGKAVRLEPLQEAHIDALCGIGLDPEVTRFMPDAMKTRGDMARFVGNALAAREAGKAIPFVTILQSPGDADRIVGTTRFMEIDRTNRRMEIGATWLGKQWQRSRVNTEAKYLMLRHAFEELKSIRIELKTDSLNVRSRAAILRIGAVQEGVFRNHVITEEGRIRHSVYFSIVAEDWPAVKTRLEAMLAR
jgi:RimJ/RimL family protein N-acetyltransferase